MAAFALNIQKAQVPLTAALIKVLTIIANVISYPWLWLKSKYKTA